MKSMRIFSQIWLKYKYEFFKKNILSYFLLHIGTTHVNNLAKNLNFSSILAMKNLPKKKLDFSNFNFNYIF